MCPGLMIKASTTEKWDEVKKSGLDEQILHVVIVFQERIWHYKDYELSFKGQYKWYKLLQKTPDTWLLFDLFYFIFCSQREKLKAYQLKSVVKTNKDTQYEFVISPDTDGWALAL